MGDPIPEDNPLPWYHLPPIDTWFDDVVPHLRGYFLVRVGGRLHVAEDLTQETLIAAVTSQTGPVPGTPLLAWFYGIARHKLLDHYRRTKRDRLQFGTLLKLEVIDIEHSPLLARLELDDIATRDAIVRVLDKLPPHQRAAFVIRYLDDCDVATTANLLGLSFQAAESLLARARRAFRRHYLELVGDDR